MVTRWPRLVIFSIIGVFPFLFFGLQETKTQNAPRNEERPVIRVEVSKFAGSAQESDVCGQCVNIAFVDDDLLALTFKISVSSSKSQIGQSTSQSSPFLFRTIFLDVRIGQVRTTNDWPSDSLSFEFLPTHDGQFLLATSEELKLHSASLELIGHRELPPKGSGSAFSHAIVSRSGRRLIIKSYAGRQTQLDLVDADSLQVLHSWFTSEPFINFTADDDAVVVETRNQIQFSRIDESWHTVYALPASNSCSNRFMRPEFIGNDALAFMDCENRVIAVDASDKLLFKKQPLAPHTEIDTITASRGGSIFGALIYKSYCAASWFECLFDPIQGAAPERAIVYDARNGRPIYERPFAVDRKHPIGEMALSPHGSRLAVLSRVSSGRADGLVEVFQLPALETPKLP
jgi:hypothetical protein